MPNILIVEDDIPLNNGIMLSLKEKDHEIIQAHNIKEAKALILAKQLDLIILDVNLPDGSGFDLCDEIRQFSSIPIIFLTAKDMEYDVVTGFELGGDDYIIKPFSLAILRARVSALLRRAISNNYTDRIIFQNFSFDFSTMEFLKDGQKIILSRTEQKLLRALILNQGRILSRTALIEKIWEEGADFVDPNALSVAINRLRNKLEENPSEPQFIKTIYGLGYTWALK
jgi:DNA-binding response OmpR family regulator